MQAPRFPVNFLFLGSESNGDVCGSVLLSKTSDVWKVVKDYKLLQRLPLQALTRELSSSGLFPLPLLKSQVCQSCSSLRMSLHRHLDPLGLKRGCGCTVCWPAIQQRKVWTAQEPSIRPIPRLFDPSFLLWVLCGRSDCSLPLLPSPFAPFICRFLLFKTMSCEPSGEPELDLHRDALSLRHKMRLRPGDIASRPKHAVQCRELLLRWGAKVFLPNSFVSVAAWHGVLFIYLFGHRGEWERDRGEGEAVRGS